MADETFICPCCDLEYEFAPCTCDMQYPKGLSKLPDERETASLDADNVRHDQNLKVVRRFITNIDEQALLGIEMMDEGEDPILKILCEIRRLAINA
ncbi:MAG: hypothetical protein ACE5H1_05320, partial [Thermodesulfobacteriota bacterium]